MNQINVQRGKKKSMQQIKNMNEVNIYIMFNI